MTRQLNLSLALNLVQIIKMTKCTGKVIISSEYMLLVRLDKRQSFKSA